MTDEELDNLASAYIDGEVTPAEAAQVEADPDAMRRVAALRSVATRLRGEVGPAPVGADQRAAEIAAALDGFGDVPSVEQAKILPFPAPSTGDPDVTNGRGFPSWLGAAAAVVLVVAGGYAAIASLSGNDNDMDTAGAETMADETDSSDESQAMDSATGQPAAADDAADAVLEEDSQQLSANTIDDSSARESDTAAASESTSTSGAGSSGAGRAEPAVAEPTTPTRNQMKHQMKHQTERPEYRRR